ncbi:MAG: hypothetical protein IIA61_08405 [Candidatus Marinimicrobia bacterium]|nr:hypothetical protein [Candidatus Neomarinimicrobiota bacterium]
MKIDLGASLTTLFTTVACPYISGVALESTILGKVVAGVKRPFVRHLFLGLGCFAIIFILGFVAPISDFLESLIERHDMTTYFGDKIKAYVFLIGIATLAVSLTLTIILFPIDWLLTRKDESNVRRKPLFR